MADLWFKIKADTSELDKAYKRLAEIDKMITNFNKKLTESEPGGKAFKEISNQLTSLEKQYEQTIKKIASLETANQSHTQKEAENQRIISQAIKETISSEKLKQETSKASIQNSKAQIEAIKLELEELKKKREFDNDAKKRAVSEEEVTRILNTQVKSIRQAEEQNKRLRIAVKNVVGEDKEANQTRATMNNRIQKNTEFIKRNTDAFVRQKMTIGQYKQEIKQAFTELQKGGNTMNNVKSIANGLSGVLKTKVSGGLSSVRDGVSTMIKGFVGAQAVISGFQKMVEAIKSGVHSIVDFEAANSKLAAILGETKNNINELIYDAKRLGATTRYTASEATALQIELAKLGFSKKEILDSTEYVLKFAQATGAELPEAAALAGASIRMFGATTQETEKYVASMAVATTKSALSFSYLQTAMPIVGPVAKAFNFTIEDTLALLGKLADAGFDASMSATATRNIILNLADANGKLAKELGGNVKTLPEMVSGLVRLRDKGIDLASTLELTDKRSVAAFNAFLSGAEKINVLREAVTNVEGDLTTMANTMTDNVQGAILGLSSAWEAFMLSFMNSTGPAKEVIDFFARGLRNIAKELASPDERQSMQNSESINLQKQQMQEFGVIDENLKRLRALYDEKVAAGMDANQAEIEAKEEYLQSYRKELEKENKLYEDLQKEKQITQDKYQNASFWKQGLFLEKTNHQYEKQIDLQVSGMAQLKGSMFKNESVIDAVENTQLTPQKTKTYTVKPEFKVSDYVDAYQHVKEIQKASQSIKDTLNKSDIDIQQQQIDLKDEGNKKQLAQIRLNYDKRYQEIQKEERDLLQKLQDEERKQWEKDNPKFKEKNLQFTPTITSLTPEQRAQFDKEYSLAYQKQEKDTQALLDKLLEKYRDYDAQRMAIEKKYNDDIAALQEARKKAEANDNSNEVAKIDRSIAKATADKGKELMKHDFDVLKQSPEYVRAFEDLRNTSSETLNSLLKQLENAKQTAAQTLNPEDLREYTTTIQEIMDELDARNPFQSLVDRQAELAEAEKELAEAKKNLDKVNSGEKIVSGTKFNAKTGKIDTTYLSATDALKKYNAAKDKSQKANNNFIKAEKTAKEKVDELANAIKGIGNSIGGTSGEIISLIGDVALFTTGTIDGITKVAKTGADAMSAVEKASVILGIISAGIQLMQQLNSILPTADNQYEKFAEKVAEINKLTDAVNEYRIAALEAQQAESSWFSDDNLKNLRDYRKLYDEVAEAYKNKAEESQAIYQNKSGGGWFTNSWNWILDNTYGKIYGVDFARKYKEGQTAAVNNLRIETRSRKKGFLGSGIGGRSQKTEDLVSWARSNGFGELFDNEGLINKEAANSILNKYGDKLVGQTKETLESLVELREKYDEYIEQLHEYVSSLYEPLVDNFVDSLWDWFDNGKDALDSFKDYASDTFRDIVSDMMRTIVLEKVVGSFSDDIAALYEEYAKGAIDETELMKKVSERTSGLVDNYENNIPTLQNIMGQVDRYLQDAGIDLRQGESTSQSSSQKGFAAMSQDTGEELSGRFTALQIASEEIKNQALEQTSLLSSINEKMSALCTIPETVGSDSVINSVSSSDGLREMLLSSLAQHDNFSGQIVEQLVAVKGEVIGLKGVVDEMRTFQVERNLDTQEIREGVQVLAKNSPVMLSHSEETKRACKSLAGK